MTSAASAHPEASTLSGARSKPLASVRTLLALVTVVALWALCHPYAGIVGDAGLYIGRALANLDADGLGRDIAFADDGQSRFSLFPLLATPIVAALGAVRAALLIAVCGVACVLAGLWALARSMAASGRMVFAILIVVAVLPVGFGGGHVMGFGETSAIPRPFAEAAVLAAYAAALSRRDRLAVAFLGLAVALHPLVAMAGVGIAAIAGFDRIARSTLGLAIGLVGCGVVLITGLALAGIAPLDRLFVRIDADWLGIVITRSPYLFPTLWDPGAFVPILVQTTTVLLVACSADSSRRRLLVALLMSTLLQLAAAALFADTLHGLLALQAQTWRATWLLAVVGGACLPPCAAGLWARGAAGRLALGLLGLAWFAQPSLPIAILLCGGTLALRLGAFGAWLETRNAVRHANWIAGAVVILLVVLAVAGAADYVAFLRSMPAGAAPSTLDPLHNDLQTIPICLLVGVWLLAPGPSRIGRETALLAGCAFGLTTLAAFAFDQRTPFRAFVERRADPPGLAALAAGRPGDVLWLGALAEPWTMLGRPQYFSAQQAPGLLFSRPLAMEWRRRADVLIGLGLVPKGVRAPWSRLDESDKVAVTPDTLATFCKRPDAPGLVILPFDEALGPSGPVTWRPPSPSFAIERRMVAGVARDDWRAVRGWTALACGRTHTVAKLPRSIASP